MRCRTGRCLLESVPPEGVFPCPLGLWPAFGMCHHICVMRALWVSGKIVHFPPSSCILGKSIPVLAWNLELRGACTPLLCDCEFA